MASRGFFSCIADHLRWPALRKSRRREALAWMVLMSVAIHVGVLHAQTRSSRAAPAKSSAPKIDPAMQRAFRMARASLDEFLQLARTAPPNLRGFALKVSVQEGDDIVEYFWINDFVQNGEMFSGKINNRPLLVKRVHAGQDFQFERADIVDWTYIDMATHTVHGNFTACALLARKPADVAAELRQKFGLACDN